MPKLVVEFSEGASEFLDNLSGETGMCKSDVLRRAIGLYKFISDEGVTKGKFNLSITHTKKNKILKDIIF